MSEIVLFGGPYHGAYIQIETHKIMSIPNLRANKWIYRNTREFYEDRVVFVYE